MSDRRNWNAEVEDVMVSILKGVVADSGRCDAGSYRPDTYEHVAATMREKMNGIEITAKYVQNKMERIKDKYFAADEMLNQSGFGWDDNKKCFTVDSPEIFKEYLKKHPNKNYTVNKSFPLYERLQIVFGKDRATDSMAESAADALDHMGLENDFVDTSEFSQLTPNSSNVASASFALKQATRRKRKRNERVSADITTVFEKSMERASADIAKLAEAITGENALARLGDELLAMGLDRVQVIRVVMYFGNKPNQLRIWSGLNNELKPDFMKAILDE